MSDLAQLLFGSAKLGAIYALAATGMVVIHKATKVVNFAHGAFVMLGAYLGYIVLQRWGLPYFVVYLVVPLAVGAVAAGLEFGLLRPIRRSDFFAVVIATVFLGIGIVELVRRTYEADLLPMPPVLRGVVVLGPVRVTYESLWIATGALTTAIGASLLFARAPVGRAMRAMASNVRGAQLCGYSVDRTYALAWFLGGALAGLAGVFVAPVSGISPELAISMLVPAFVAAVIGGFDSLGGAIVGGLILGTAEVLSAFYVSAAFQSVVSLLILFLVLMVRPAGLFAPLAARSA